jgi:hypothetical protein
VISFLTRRLTFRRPSSGKSASVVRSRAAKLGVKSGWATWWWQSKIKATLVPIGSDRPSRHASLISGFCIPATWTRAIFISSRSTPDARKGHFEARRYFEAVVVVVVVVIQPSLILAA